MTYPKTDLLALNGTSGEVEFFQLDTTTRGGPTYYLTSTWATGGTVTQGGTAYTCLPMTLSKAKLSTTDPLPQPQLSMAVTENAQLRATIAAYGDLVGCKVRRFTTFEKYLDAVNYPRVNLLNYSEDLTQSNWAKNNVTLTSNAALAPNGTLTADLVMDNATNTQHYVSVNTASTVVVGDLVNFSVYVKDAGTGSVLVYGPNLTALGGGPVVRLSDGVITSYNTASGVFNASVQDAGNGWWRIMYSTYATAATFSLRVFCTPSGSASAPAYVGDGTKGFYIWGAQIQRPSNSTISASTMTAVGSSITLNTAGTLDPVGTNTAAIIGEDTGTGTHYANQTVAGFKMGTEVTYTCHLKAGSVRTQAMVRFLASTALPTTCFCFLDLTTGAVSGVTGLSRTPTVTAMANGFWRISISAIAVADGAMSPSVFIAVAGNNTYTGTSNGIYYWNGSLTWDSAIKSYQYTTTTHAPYADPTVTSPVETYVIAQLVDYSPSTVTWRLATPIDRPNLVLPRLQYLADDVGESATPPRCVYAPGLSRAMEI